MAHSNNERMTGIISIDGCSEKEALMFKRALAHFAILYSDSIGFKLTIPDDEIDCCENILVCLNPSFNAYETGINQTLRKLFSGIVKYFIRRIATVKFWHPTTTANIEKHTIEPRKNGSIDKINNNTLININN